MSLPEMLSEKVSQLLPVIMSNRKWRITARIVAIMFGFGLGLFGVFQILFLYRVIPHGGLW